MFTDKNIFDTFQVMLSKEHQSFIRCQEHPDLYCHAATAKGKLLVMYCYKEKHNGKAVAVFINDCTIDGFPTFNMLYGVKKKLQGKGFGSRIVKEAIEQFRLDMSKAKMTPRFDALFVTAYVDVNNLVSQKVAQRHLSPQVKIIKDSITKKPQYYYVKRLVLR